MLSLSESGQVHRWARHLHRLQRNPWIVYGAALGAFFLATFIRWAMGGFVHDRIPFTTYYPAIVIATLLGGFWLGMLASILSAIVALWNVHATRIWLCTRCGTTNLTYCLRSRLLAVGRHRHRP